MAWSGVEKSGVEWSEVVPTDTSITPLSRSQRENDRI